MQLGNGIQKISARPIKVYVDAQGEVWYCDVEVDAKADFLAAGCSPLSQSPNHK